MVYIPNGEFIMGNPDDPRTEGGRHVLLKPYLIDRYEVTAELFAASTQTGGGAPAKQGKGSRLPATQVTFQEAETHCRKADKRLPSEAEWEKAARGVDGRKWPWLVYVSHPNNGFSGFTPEDVDKRPEWVSPYGVYGMGYNVWEWVEDWYSFKDMPVSDEKKFKVLRGGLTQTHLTIQFSPTYYRNWMVPDAAYNFIGFRCARDAG